MVIVSAIMKSHAVLLGLLLIAFSFTIICAQRRIEKGEAVKAAEATEDAETVEAAKAAEDAEATEDAETVDAAKATEDAEATEDGETVDAAKAAEDAEATEDGETVDAAKAAEDAEATEDGEAAENDDDDDLEKYLGEFESELEKDDEMLNLEDAGKELKDLENEEEQTDVQKHSRRRRSRSSRRRRRRTSRRRRRRISRRRRRRISRRRRRTTHYVPTPSYIATVRRPYGRVSSYTIRKFNYQLLQLFLYYGNRGMCLPMTTLRKLILPHASRRIRTYSVRTRVSSTGYINANTYLNHLMRMFGHVSSYQACIPVDYLKKKILEYQGGRINTSGIPTSRRRRRRRRIG